MRVALIILVVVILGGAIFWFNKEPAIAPNGTVSPLATLPTVSPTLPILSPTPSESQNRGSSIFQPSQSPDLGKIGTTPTPAPTPKTVTITFANNTANPLNVEIKVGDTVKFVNNDDAQRWPASGIHPTHQICPGFDSLRGLNKDESYSFTFNEAKTCPWHDHLNPSLKGQIVVQ